MSTPLSSTLSDFALLEAFLQASVEEDFRVRVLARRVLPAEWVNGNSERIPSVPDIVERLVAIAERKLSPQLPPLCSPLTPPFP